MAGGGGPPGGAPLGGGGPPGGQPPVGGGGGGGPPGGAPPAVPGTAQYRNLFVSLTYTAEQLGKAFSQLPELVNKNGFALWQKRIILLMRAARLEEHFSHSPLQGNYDGLVYADVIVLGITSRMSNDLAAHFMCFDLVPDLWDALAQRFQTKTSVLTAVQISDLFKCAGPIHKFQETLDLLLARHAELVANNETPPDNIFISAISSATPDLYKHVISTYEESIQLRNDLRPGLNARVDPFELIERLSKAVKDYMATHKH